MGLFGFGKKKQKDEKAQDADEKDEKVEEVEDSAEDEEAEEPEEAEKASDEADEEDSDEDSDEGSDEDEDESPDPDEPGPWDYDEDDVDPDFDERYISFGSVFLPIIPGMTIRAKRQKLPDGTMDISSINVEWGKSSVEIVPMAAPKTLSLWDDMADELLGAKGATSKEGRFGNEVFLPVTAGGKKQMTRIVGVDGPRWMLRGIFTGQAADVDTESEDRTTLEDYFSRVIVRRGPEPIAPRDVIPILPPKTADQRRAEAKAAEDAAKAESSKVKKTDDGPQNYDQEHKVQTTITRGPMFSELR